MPNSRVIYIVVVGVGDFGVIKTRRMNMLVKIKKYVACSINVAQLYFRLTKKTKKCVSLYRCMYI